MRIAIVLWWLRSRSLPNHIAEIGGMFAMAYPLSSRRSLCRYGDPFVVMAGLGPAIHDFRLC